MNARNNDDARIQEIFNDLADLSERIDHSGMTRERYVNPADPTDALLADGITYQVYRILEEVVNLTDRTRVMFPTAPWDEMRGLRNRLAHDYPGTDFGIVWDAIQDGLPELKEVCTGYAGMRGIELGEESLPPDSK